MPTGYRVVSYDIATLSAKTLMERKPVDLTLGGTHQYQGGIFLGTSKEFCEYYLGGTDDSDLILEFEFDEGDIVRGDLSPNCEILVRKATLKSVQFEDESLGHHFAHHFDVPAIEQRRAACRGVSLAQAEGGKRATLIRAMDARSGHIMPMDYVYVTDGIATHSAAKRVLKAYEDGLPVRGGLDQIINKALSHAVTTAIYEESAQKVAFAMVGNRHVYKAPNEGEHFYDNDSPLLITGLLEVSTEGVVSLSASPRTQELSR